MFAPMRRARPAARALLVLSLAASLAGRAAADDPVSTIHVRAWIDGRSQLVLQGLTAQWRHFEFAAPGRLDCDIGVAIQPTLLDGLEWWPTWPDDPDCENRDCGGCTSDVFDGLASGVPQTPLGVELDVIEARGPCTLVELPHAGNDWTLVVELDDRGPGAADWYELEVVFSECAVSSYCAATANSSGQPALLSLLGSASMLADDAKLRAQGCPSGSMGLFVYGSGTAQLPFGNGYLCLNPFLGLNRLDPPVLELGGAMECALDYAAMPPSAPITAGSTWNFQLWYRDPAAGGAGFNLSNGLTVRFCP